MTPDRPNVPPPRRAGLDNAIQPRWPARAHNLLTNIHALCADWLHEPLRQCLNHFEVLLAQPTASSTAHKRPPRTRQQQIDEHKAFDQRFIARIDKAFNELGMPQPTARSGTSTPLLAPSSLTLLDPVQHDLDGTLVQMLAASETRHGPMLIELGYRLAVLIGSAPLTSALLPMGPPTLAAAFRAASPALGLTTSQELVLAQSFETSLMLRMQPLYELINGYLRAEGILPNLHPFGSPRSLHVPPPRVASVSPRVQTPQVNLAPDTYAAPAPVSANATDVAQILSPARGPMRSRHSASPSQLQDALSTLQRNFAELDAQLRRELRGPAMLQQELIDQLNIDHSFGADRIELTSEQVQVIERVAGLFGAIVQRLPAGNGMARPLLEDLQLPILRMALGDPAFFSAAEHPARQWLNDMACAAHYWLDGTAGPHADALGKALLKLVARASNETPDAALFADLDAQLQHALQPLQHAANDAELIQVHTLQDQDRLHEARLRADELLKRRSARLPADSPLRELLEPAWRDVLALSLLRHGEASETFGIQLVIADQLLGRLPAGDRDKLQARIEDSLRQIGMPRSDASALARKAVGASGAPPAASGATATSQLAMRLRQRPKPYIPADPHENVDDAPASRIKVQHRDLHRHLQQLPALTWFEFAATATTPARRYRLAWCSPVSGRCLFVDHHGQAGEQLSLADFAEATQAGRIRELQSSQEVFAQAWGGLDAGVARAAGVRP